MSPSEQSLLRDENVRRKVRRWRFENRISAKELSEAIGLAGTTITHFENARRDIPLHALVRLAGMMDVSIFSIATSAQRPLLLDLRKAFQEENA